MLRIYDAHSAREGVLKRTPPDELPVPAACSSASHPCLGRRLPPPRRWGVSCRMCASAATPL